jgi:hypothetical protein
VSEALALKPGAWHTAPGTIPTTPKGTTVTNADNEALLARKVDDPTTSDNSQVSLLGMLWDTGMHAGRADAKADAILAALAKVQASLDALNKR